MVNGQKTWSTGAHLSDYALCPVRTRWDVPKHHGISVLIVDLRSPGIEVRRIRQINGGAELCEEFLTDVVVPASNLVGEENEGWRVARTLLEIEHAWPGRAWNRRVDAELAVHHLVALAKQKVLDEDPGVRRRIAQLHVATEVQSRLSAAWRAASSWGSCPRTAVRSRSGTTSSSSVGRSWRWDSPVRTAWCGTLTMPIAAGGRTRS